jgi:methionyl-tRNA synthetase
VFILAPMTPRPAYITTPIYYVNDRPHIGHAYTTTICDVWARAMRLAGREVFFLTGTDEHGQKVEKSAHERGMEPQALADENAAEFQRVLGLFGLSNDDFIRTTEPRHERQVQEFVRRLLARGDVYLGQFEGWYDEGQEEYHTETRAKELDYRSPISGRPLVRAKERNWYFRLSAYQGRLEELFAASPGFVRPEGRFNETLGRLRQGLQDVPITRTNFSWGIPMPAEAAGAAGERHVIYVWIDALFNYATALGLAEPGGEAAARARFWPAEYHVIGKEILWFHAVIWPALLMALGLPLPRCIYAHSFWIAGGQKMSKSLGNFVDLPTIEGYLAAYGLDAWRWYMATQGPIDATDADFSAKHFHDTYTSELVNTFANCASRTTAMLAKSFEGRLPISAASAGRRIEQGHDWPALAAAAVGRARACYGEFDLRGAAQAGLGLLRSVDGFINATEPFRLAKDPTQRERLGAILAQCVEAVRVANHLLGPIMPGRTGEVLRAMGDDTVGRAGSWDCSLEWGMLAQGTRIARVAPFPRIAIEQSPAAESSGER